jgi:hypothetical protein
MLGGLNSTNNKGMMLSDNKPNFFIAGAPKCGTTALDQYLATHPDIFMARKEMHFFGSDLKFGAQFFRRDRAAYLREFNARDGQTFVGESSVWYLYSRYAADEIKAFNPDARIIIMLRDPVALLHALFCAFSADGNENLPTFKEALAAEEERRAGRRIGRQAYLPQALIYREVPRFAEQVQRYFNVFGRDRVHVIIYDDFNADNAGMFRQTLEFLGADPHWTLPAFNPVNANVNGPESVRSPFMRDLLNDPLVRGTAIKLRAWLPRPIFAWVQKKGLALNASNFISSASKRTPLDDDLKISLRREFAPEVERLSDLLGKDLTHWIDPAGKSTVGQATALRKAAPVPA